MLDNLLTRLYVRSQARLMDLKDRRESGADTLEYVGMFVVAAAIVTALITVFKNGGTVSNSLQKLVTDAIDTIKVG
ncbi:DUF4244 domain-containing protein [Mobiluncus porci]|nr:DUF4244 domain-containing protein [Mobiluncus porci]